LLLLKNLFAAILKNTKKKHILANILRKNAMKIYNLLLILCMPICQDIQSTGSEQPPHESWRSQTTKTISASIDWLFDTTASLIFGCAENIHNNIGIDVKHLENQKKEYECSLGKIERDIATMVKQISSEIHTELSNKEGKQILDLFESLATSENMKSNSAEHYFTQTLAQYTKQIAEEQKNYDVTFGNLHEPSLLRYYLRCGGYCVALATGAYIGNKLYTTLLQHHFTKRTTQAELIKKITELEDQQQIMQARYEEKEELLETASDQQQRIIRKALQKLKATLDRLKREIETLQNQLYNPQKPSYFKRLLGTTVRCTLIALAAYGAYSFFEKVDTNYLKETELNGIQKELLAQKAGLQNIINHKKELLNKAKELLYAHRRNVLDNLFHLYAEKKRLIKSLEEINQQLHNMPIRKQAQIMNTIIIEGTKQ
jgi:hypothetical protein